MRSRTSSVILVAFILATSGCGGAGGTAGVSIPMPTPVPTASPVPAPVTASPGSLTFSNTGSHCGPTGSASCAQTFTVSEAGYAGPFTATSGNTAVATVAAGPGANDFTVTPVGGGSTAITVQNTTMQQTTVNITVTSTPITVQ